MMWLTRRKPSGWTAWFKPDGMAALEGLPASMRSLLKDIDFADAAVRRLFPPAFREDPEAEEEYQSLLREDLVRRKLEAVEAFERTLAGRRERKLLFGSALIEVDLGDEDLTFWLGFLHDMRLVIGTRLDVTDASWQRSIAPSDPHAAEMLLLHHLAAMEEMILRALRKMERLELLG